MRMKRIFDELQKLNDAGFTDKFIGELLDIPQPTICRMRNRHFKSVPYDRGEAILKLAKNLLKPQKDDKHNPGENP